MTAPNIVAEVALAGGKLWLTPQGRLRYSLPPAAAPLIEQLREHRAEVVRLLQAPAESWAAPDGSIHCDCGRPPASAAAPAPTDHPAGCPCAWCWAWRARQPFHATIPSAAPGERAEPTRFPREGAARCACGGPHRPCGLTGRCGLECPCPLCDGWRKHNKPARAGQPAPTPDIIEVEALRPSAPPPGAFEARFGEGTGYLALPGCPVRTPRGTGRCIQAFRHRCAVNLGERDAKGRPIVSFFSPADLEVIE